MKISLISLLLASPLAVFAAEKGPDEKADVVPKDYPLMTCVVSGESLTEMGKPFEYVHKEAGKPDRQIMLCCERCLPDVKADPAKYLKKIDEAAKKPDRRDPKKDFNEEHH
jgi:hypothetical protein